MPLTQLVNKFEGVTLTSIEVVVHRPGWLFAQRCEASWAVEGCSDEPFGTLLVYRSVMVRDTQPMYKPCRDILLGAARLDVLAHGFIEDPNMMYGRGEYLVIRMTNSASFPEGPFTGAELREMASRSVAGALGAAGVSA